MCSSGRVQVQQDAETSQRIEKTQHSSYGVVSVAALLKLVCRYWNVAAHQEKEQLIPDQTKVTIRAETASVV